MRPPRSRLLDRQWTRQPIPPPPLISLAEMVARIEAVRRDEDQAAGSAARRGGT